MLEMVNLENVGEREQDWNEKVIENQIVANIKPVSYTHLLPAFELGNGLSVVPSCLDLSAAESELINEPGRELILKGLIRCV